MVTIILSIIFWCKPENRKLGIAALILSIIGFVVDLFLTGWLSIMDLVVASINALVLYKHKDYY